jgi:hypothetical protein
MTKPSYTFGVELKPEQAAAYLGITMNQLQLLRHQSHISIYKSHGGEFLFQSEVDKLKESLQDN